MQCSRLQSAVAAPQHLWPQSQPSPYLLPAPPSPAPSLRLRPLPPSLGPGRFRPASRCRVAPTPVRQGRSSGGGGAATLGPANQICSVRVGPHLTLPLRNSVQRELSVTEVSAPGEGWGGNKRRYIIGHSVRQSPWRPAHRFVRGHRCCSGRLWLRVFQTRGRAGPGSGQEPERGARSPPDRLVPAPARSSVPGVAAGPETATSGPPDVGGAGAAVRLIDPGRTYGVTLRNAHFLCQRMEERRDTEDGS